MITGKIPITDYFNQVQKPYFAIFYKGQVEKGNAIFRNDKEGSEQDFESGRADFDRTLAFLSHGDYTVVISEKQNVTTRGANRVDFRIPVSEAAPAAGAAGIQGTGAVAGTVTLEEVERKANEIADKRFKALMAEKELTDTKAELAETKKELKEAEKKATEPWTKLVTALSPHTKNIIAGLFPNSGAAVANLQLSGLKPDATGEGDPDAQKTFEDFLEALSSACPDDWKKILVKLTNLIKESPDKFETAINFL